MEITSIHFLFFVLGILVVYHLLPHRAQNYWLLITSYAFYLFWSWKFALLLLAVTIFHFELGKYLRKEGQGRAIFLWFAIGVNLALFMTFKAADFYLYRLAGLLGSLGIDSGLGALQIVIPLGLSYYVLQNISYLVDVYRGQIPASTNLVDFALYLAYFPKMVAGPIERARTFLPLLATPRRVENSTLTRSLILIITGMTRKLLIANLLFAYFPWKLLNRDISAFSKLELIGWLAVYSFALYNDFAGYTNIVRGVSCLFGIELSSNFSIPYISRSFTEFWNRWHITLSQWLRDYIFFPTSRMLARRFTNKTAWQNLIIPPILTMLVSGLWHKPSWHMLLWGALHGSYLVAERLLILQKPEWVQGKGHGVWSWLNTAVVFSLVSLAWVPFSMNLPMTLSFFRQFWFGNTIGFMDYRLLYSLVVIAPALILDWIELQGKQEVFFLRQSWPVQAGLLATFIVLILIVTSGTRQPFIYQGF